jgi:hypothetical protein
MKNLVNRGFLSLIVLMVSGCSSYQYYSVQSNNTVFTKYRTFAWLPPTDTSKNGTYANIVDGKLKYEITAKIESRGLVLKAVRPDLLVRYSIVINNKTRTYNNPAYVYRYRGNYPGAISYRSGRHFYYAYRAPFPVYLGTEIEQIPYKEGTLIIDLIDRRIQHVIWRGYGIGEIDNPQKAINDIPMVVDGIINKLPLKPVSK